MDDGGLRMVLLCSHLVAEPGKIVGAIFQRFFPTDRDDRGGDEELEDSAHWLRLVMTLALGVEPVGLPLFVRVDDMAGEGFWRQGSDGFGRRRCLNGWLGELGADHGR